MTLLGIAKRSSRSVVAADAGCSRRDSNITFMRTTLACVDSNGLRRQPRLKPPVVDEGVKSQATPHCCFPFEGKSGMGMGRRAAPIAHELSNAQATRLVSFPFKEKDGMGWALSAAPIAHGTIPMSQRMHFQTQSQHAT